MIEKTYHITMTLAAACAICIMLLAAGRMYSLVDDASAQFERVEQHIAKAVARFSDLVDRFERRKLFQPSTEIMEEP